MLYLTLIIWIKHQLIETYCKIRCVIRKTKKIYIAIMKGLWLLKIHVFLRRCTLGMVQAHTVSLAHAFKIVINRPILLFDTY